jgi:carbon storage regulator
MLILSRNPGESLHIGDSIKVRILSVRGDRVRLGVDAPRAMEVHREEVVQRIRGRAEQAASFPEPAGDSQ